MKFFRFISIFAPVLLAGLALRAELADGVKAVVSDAVITYSQVEEFTAPAADALRRQYADTPDLFQQKLNDALGDSLEQLVERQLILRSFNTEGYQLPEDYVDQLVQDRIRERFGDLSGTLPVTEAIARRTLALPFHNGLEEGEIEHVLADV